MAFPKKIKKHIPISPEKILFERREELLKYIQENGTYLPKGVLHADLDRGMLDFVKNELEISVEGEKVPAVDIIVTTQNWIQFTETWNFQDLDKNIEPPFVATVRKPEVIYGSTPSLQYTIPNRRLFYYATVPTWSGQRKGVDVYKIPQPVPVDITYNVKIFCTKIRHLNEFNRVVLEKFSSRQSYTEVKGHYIPIIMNSINDESVVDMEKRRYYVQDYEFLLMGFLLDEEEFEVSPAITRLMTLYETNLKSGDRNADKQPENPNIIDWDIIFTSGTTELSEKYNYNIDIGVVNTTNVTSYSVYINDNLIGSDIVEIPITTNDYLKIIVVKDDNTQSAIIKASGKLL